MQFSVVVPSVGRPLSLRRTLDAVRRCDGESFELIVVARETDSATQSVADEFGARCVRVEEPGLAQAMLMGARHSKGDFVVFTDDDAAPDREWLVRLAAMYMASDQVMGCGGRDIVYDEGRERGVTAVSQAAVGRVRWFGRVEGNHHRSPRGVFEVDHLKGANCSFRRTSFLGLKHEGLVSGSGAQTRNEFLLSLAATQHGGRLLFDGDCVVHHFPEKRMLGDSRAVSAAKAFEAAHNESLAFRLYRSRFAYFMNVAFLILVGYPHAPGLARIRTGVPIEIRIATVRGVMDVARRNLVHQ